MGRQRPLVSVGMPVYNEQRYIGAALRCILSQTFEDFELIIGDNASTDGTREICQAVEAGDPRVKYHRHDSNIGSIANFNRVFELARGEYFVWASGHDLRSEHFLARSVEVLEGDRSVVLTYPRARWIEADGTESRLIGGCVETRGLDRVSAAHVVLWGLAYAYPIYGLMRADALRRTSVMRNVVGPDIVLLLELSLLGAFAQIAEPLLCMRKLDDYGSWKAYLRKSFGPSRPRRAAFGLSAGWIHEQLAVALRRELTVVEKTALLVSILLCMATKYRFVLTGLRGSRDAA